MRGILALLFAVVGLACAVYVQTMSYVGGNVLDSGRFAETTLDTLSGDEGSAAAARLMTAVVDRRATSSGFTIPAAARERVESGLTAALRADGVVDVLRPAVTRAHAAYLDGDRAEFSLAPLRPRVVVAVEAYRPDAVRLVPPESDFPVVRVPVAARDDRLLDLAERLRDGVGIALLVGLAAFGASIAVSRRRAGTLVLIGVFLCVAAALPPLVHGGAAVVAAGLVDADAADPLAQALVEGFTGGWLRATVLTLAVGIGAIVVAVVSGGRSR